MFQIRTFYYDHKHQVITSNAAKDANRAVESALKHMAVNHYGARTASVVDMETSEEHATIRLMPNGEIRITYIRDARKHERRLNLTALQEELDKHNK